MFGDIDTRIQALESVINALDQLGDLRPLSEAELVRNQALFPMLQTWKIRKDSVSEPRTLDTRTVTLRISMP